jgi:hypothetical protein
VAVWSLDRFGRSRPQIVVNVYELVSLGVEFVSLTQAIDLSTMQGRLTLYVCAMLAEIERDLIAQRVRAGLAVTRARGRGQSHNSARNRWNDWEPRSRDDAGDLGQLQSAAPRGGLDTCTPTEAAPGRPSASRTRTGERTSRAVHSIVDSRT